MSLQRHFSSYSILPRVPLSHLSTAWSLGVEIEDGLPRENQLSGVWTFLARSYSVYRCQLARLQTDNLANVENKSEKWSVTGKKAQELVLCLLLRQHSGKRKLFTEITTYAALSHSDDNTGTCVYVCMCLHVSVHAYMSEKRLVSKFSHTGETRMETIL